MHSFLAEQPDLNWRNPNVRAAFADILRFWLRRGVDGFRLDASGVLIKDALLRDDPPNPEADENTPPANRLRRVYTDIRPGVFDCIAELRNATDEFPGCFLAGEADTAVGRIARFYGSRQSRDYTHPSISRCSMLPGMHSVGAAIDQYLEALPEHATPNWAIGGHDKKRIVDRTGPAQARVAAMLLMSLPGTLFFCW
ncbi:MAG: hypothetical protein JO110_06125 [Acetobacteraceae bacterium]|nr:hypothetical protein [Acetobacteraceae bacterium]